MLHRIQADIEIGCFIGGHFPQRRADVGNIASNHHQRRHGLAADSAVRIMLGGGDQIRQGIAGGFPQQSEPVTGSVAKIGIRGPEKLTQFRNGRDSLAS